MNQMKPVSSGFQVPELKTSWWVLGFKYVEWQRQEGHVLDIHPFCHQMAGGSAIDAVRTVRNNHGDEADGTHITHVIDAVSHRLVPPDQWAATTGPNLSEAPHG